MKKFILNIFIFCLPFFTSKIGFSQQLPVFSQYLQNPYQFNPSFVANNGYSEANIFYRKQWISIENAPEALALNFQLPAGRNVALGLNLNANKTVLLTNNLASLTFGYKLRIQQNHALNFGISAGVGFNNFDLDALENINDPALADLVQKSSYFAAQAGINYQVKGLTLGFALPKLFDSKVNTADDFQEINVSPFENIFASAGYRIPAGSSVVIEPTLIYRANDINQRQWEGMVMATYRDFLWVGASYREGYGVTGFIGVRLKNKIRVGYAYELPTDKGLSSASNGSHELFLGLRIGDRNREEEIYAQQPKQDSLKQVAANTEINDEIEEEVTKELPAISEIEEQKVETPPIIVKQAPVEPAVQVQKQPELQPDPVMVYYLIVGVYSLEQNALRNYGALRSKWGKAGMIYIPEKDFYYVYLYSSTSKTEVIAELNKIRISSKFYGAWLYKRTN